MTTGRAGRFLIYKTVPHVLERPQTDSEVKRHRCHVGARFADRSHQTAVDDVPTLLVVQRANNIYYYGRSISHRANASEQFGHV